MMRQVLNHNPTFMEQFRDPDIEEAGSSAVSNIVEQVMWHLAEEQELHRDRAMEIIAECDGSETAAIGLSLDQQLEVVEEGTVECGFGDLSFNLEDLRSSLESHAVMFIHMLAESRTYGIFEELFDFMDEHELEPEQMRDANNFGWFPHRSEREEGENCAVYEYRDIEDPGNHVDVWEYRLPSGERVWFKVRVSE